MSVGDIFRLGDSATQSQNTLPLQIAVRSLIPCDCRCMESLASKISHHIMAARAQRMMPWYVIPGFCATTVQLMKAVGQVAWMTSAQAECVDKWIYRGAGGYQVCRVDRCDIWPSRKPEPYDGALTIIRWNGSAELCNTNGSRSGPLPVDKRCD
ncbi:hypothetical protein BO71DRAFT_221286 [Aspergillus ellipticus CBS 707.79]|uniref:Uncharacterized protein n=1 Tax=Aspergillus ellipticus CBS 707.79 TaxID=1448320 RepID=A0A319DYL6_9EURO|nr:hypothetical protein BO71DRAFT_221286 [Aspergillus ellipticus CBS 707.79]